MALPFATFGSRKEKRIRPKKMHFLKEIAFKTLNTSKPKLKTCFFTLPSSPLRFRRSSHLRNIGIGPPQLPQKNTKLPQLPIVYWAFDFHRSGRSSAFRFLKSLKSCLRKAEKQKILDFLYKFLKESGLQANSRLLALDLISWSAAAFAKEWSDFPSGTHSRTNT